MNNSSRNDKSTAKSIDVRHLEDEAYNFFDVKNDNIAGKAPKKRTVGFTESSYLDFAGFKRRQPRKSKRLTFGTVIRRILVSILAFLLFVLVSVYAVLFSIAKGPSETVRNTLVLSAKQASATKWVPSLFLDSKTIDKILADSKKVTTDSISLDSYSGTPDGDDVTSEDEWADAVDGMLYREIKGATYKAYMLIVKDPSRVFVGTSSDFKSGKQGSTIFDAAKKYDAVAAINGGEFSDPGGVGTGDNPIGLTYSLGECVWSGDSKRTFIGFDENNRLVVSEGMTKKRAEELNIRDAVSFQTGNVLISSDGDNVTLYYANGNTGTAQRTAIGQRRDGAVILLVTDGRSASSLGATHNDIIDIMVEYGAINAAMLDGGSSSMIYYENYYEKYGKDYEMLDQYQKRGLINKYKAFTTPRQMPTFFMVSKNEGGVAE